MNTYYFHDVQSLLPKFSAEKYDTCFISNMFLCFKTLLGTFPSTVHGKRVSTGSVAVAFDLVSAEFRQYT